MGLLTDPDSYFMQQAIKMAETAIEQDEVPVGAVVVSNGHIIARAHNLVERLNDPTAHAEMQAITAACNHLGSKYLTDCTLYVTLEPCTMCATAAFWAQTGRLVYGASDPKQGFSRHDRILHPKTEVLGGVEAETCSQLVKDFFQGKRRG